MSDNEHEKIFQAEKSFHIADYCIFIAFIFISLSIGLWHAFSGGKQKTTQEFLLADGKLRILPASLSMLVSFVSAIIVLGHPAEMYVHGTQLVIRVLGYVVGIMLSTIIFVPLLYPLKLKTVFEYLELRFQCHATRLLAALSYLIGNVFYMSLVLYTPAIALEAVTGIPFYASILVNGLVSVIYTVSGGMRAVIWTDVFQSAVMTFGMMAIVIQGTIKVGGFSNMWHISDEGGRINFFDFTIDPDQRLSFWSLICGGTFSALAIFGGGQASLQRYSALSNITAAKRSLYLNIPGILLISTLATVTGLVVYSYYTTLGCDPLQAKYITSSNQLVPYFMIDVLNYPGLLGIFLAVLFSGALSSMSSILNSCAVITWEDFIKNIFYDLKEARKATITKLLVIAYGVLGIGTSYLTSQIGVHVLQASLSFTGATTGPFLGMYLLGAFFPFGNKYGAFGGCGVASVFCLWLAIGSFINLPYTNTPLPTTVENCAVLNSSSQYDAHYNNNTTNITKTTSVEVFSLYKISYMWYNGIGASIALLLGVIISVITGGSNEVDSSLILTNKFRLPHKVKHSLHKSKSYHLSHDQVYEKTSTNEEIEDKL